MYPPFEQHPMPVTAQATSRMWNIHARLLDIADTQQLPGAAMLAVIDRGDGLQLGAASRWVRDIRNLGGGRDGILDTRSLLRRRYAQALRDPGSSPWNTTLRGVARSGPHNPGEPPGSAPEPGRRNLEHSTELWLLDGGYLRWTTTDTGFPVIDTATVGTWHDPAIAALTPSEILDGLTRRPEWVNPLAELARNLGLDDHGTASELHRSILQAARTWSPEPGQDTVGGLDVATWSLLPTLAGSPTDLADLVTGRWDPWAR